jgi:DNA-3-methyladenine glycosylase II
MRMRACYRLGRFALASKEQRTCERAPWDDGVVSSKRSAALAHLRAADPVMSALIDSVGVDGLGDERRGRPPDHYGALVRSIVGQQLSVKAAASIYARLIDRYGGRPPTPAEVLADDPDELRAAAGLSRAKVTYLRSLAEHVTDGSLELDVLESLDDERVIEELVAVKGIGTWSAHMFLMFHLQRPDVLPVGDLGIRRAVMSCYGLDKPPAPEVITEIAESWRPYRTLACLYLWHSLNATPNEEMAT